MQSDSSDNCVNHYNVDILNPCDPELQLINTKPMIKIKELVSELKMYKVQTILVFDYKKRNLPFKCYKLTASNSEIDEAFKSMHESIMAKTKKICL